MNSSNSDTLHSATGLFDSRLNSAFIEQQNAPDIAQLSQFLTPPMNNPTGLTFGIDNRMRSPRKRCSPMRPGSSPRPSRSRAALALFPLRHLRLQQRVGLLLHPAGATARQSAGQLRLGERSDPARRRGLDAQPKSHDVRVGLQGLPPRRGEHDDSPDRLPRRRPCLIRPRYRLGLRGRREGAVRGNRIRVNADVYYIKWDKVQQTALLSCGTQYTTNAGDGKSYGPEIEIAAKIAEHWTFSLSGTYTKATITNVSPGYVQSLTNSATASRAAATAPAAASRSSTCRRRRPAPRSSTPNRSATSP